MKIYKKLTAGVCAAVMLLCAVPNAGAAYTRDESRDADVLYTLELIQGSDKGYELYRAPTRAEALVLTVRLAGGEDEKGEYHNPFTDVPEWAEKYAAYAYAAGLVNGTDAGIYGFDQPVSEDDYATMLLRVLGYSDALGEFTWEQSALFAARLGIKRSDDDGSFTRADMFSMTCDTLTTRLKGKTTTLIERLAADGDVDGAKANAIGMSIGGELDGAEIYERCIDAVFSISFYENETGLQLNEPIANASGFFISQDGVAVSNYHAFANSSVAVITLNNGEKYRVTEILSYDKLTDLVVFRVSSTSLDMKLNSFFPCLEYVHSDNVRNGETVYAIGSPLTLSGTITSGIVSYKNREVQGFGNPMIQNTAAISQGNSGGVLVNAYGQAIGSTCAYFINGHSLNLAIPLNILFELDLSAPGCTIAEMNEQVAAQEAEETDENV
ncbi:MAG: trypsin-like peptidase domain-containing protein [Clostridiales bacterium]|nr:trypsin-like peptidase domain-containing protein [Clostridiales bacterium]